MTLSDLSKVNKQIHIVLYIGHAYDLTFFLRLVPLIKNHGEYTFSAIVAMDTHLGKIACLESFLKELTSDYIIVLEDQVPRLGTEFLLVSSKIKNILSRIKRMIYEAQLFVSLDKSQLLPHLLLSKFKRSILIQTFEPLDLTDDYKIAWKSTFLANLYHTLFSAKWKIIRSNKKSNYITHHQVISQNVEIVYKNGDEAIKNRIVLPPLTHNGKLGNKVILFGSRFLSWDFFTEKMKIDLLEYYKEIGDCLSGFTFLYKPHPAEKDDEFNLVKSCFPSGNIENIGYDLSSELVLLMTPGIEYCFSLSSTSSLSAFEMGFKSFVLYKQIGFPVEVERTYDNIFKDASEDFYLNDVSSLLKLPKLKPNQGYMNYFLNLLSVQLR
jgi:hypothetical protein